jgi:hypothetical protein
MLVRWQDWMVERTAYVQALRQAEVREAFAYHPSVDDPQIRSVPPDSTLFMLHNADDGRPATLFSDLREAIIEAAEHGYVVALVNDRREEADLTGGGVKICPAMKNKKGKRAASRGKTRSVGLPRRQSRR